MAIIESKKAGVLVLGVPGKKTSNPVIMPGVNVVPDKVWEICKQQDSVKLKIEEGILVVAEEPTEGPKGGRVPSKDPWKLEDPKKATALAKKTLSIPLLEAWLEAEGRAEVRAALSNQLDKMKK